MLLALLCFSATLAVGQRTGRIFNVSHDNWLTMIVTATGETRSYMLYAPNTTVTGLVVALHGVQGSGWLWCKSARGEFHYSLFHSHSLPFPFLFFPQ